MIEKHALEGMYMAPGTRFYRIASLSTIWVHVTIFEYQLPWVRVGQPVHLELPYWPGEVFHGKVIYLYPYVDPKTRQIRVRLEFPNPEIKLKPGMYGDVVIESGDGQTSTKTSEPSLLVPRDAVIDVGRREPIDGVEQHVGHAYVEVGPGRFEPRQVVIGEELENGELQILSGLKEDEAVVVSGQFELDGERKVKEANMRMLRGNDKKSEAASASSDRGGAATSPSDLSSDRPDDASRSAGSKPRKAP